MKYRLFEDRAVGGRISRKWLQDRSQRLWTINPDYALEMNFTTALASYQKYDSPVTWLGIEPVPGPAMKRGKK